MQKESKRKVLATFLAFTMVLTLIKLPGSVVKAEVIENQKVIFDFEDGQTHFSIPDNGPGTLSNVDNPSGDGKVLKVESDVSTQIRVTNDKFLVPGSIITMKVYYSSEKNADLMPYIMDTNWGAWTSGWINNSSEKETWIDVEFEVPSNYGEVGVFGFKLENSNAGAIYFDDFKVTYPEEKEEETNKKTIFDFEDNNVGFTVNDAAKLEVVQNISGNGKVVSVNFSNTAELRIMNDNIFVPGSTVTMMVYYEAGKNADIMPFVMDINSENWKNGWVNNPSDKEKWFEVEYEIPSDYGDVGVFGVQLLNTNAGKVYIDDVKIQYAPVNKVKLNATIDEATKLLASVVEGTEAGQYEVGSKAVLKAELDKAIEVQATDATTQKIINQTTVALQAAIDTLKSKQVKLTSSLELGLKGELKDSEITVTWNAASDAVSYKVLKAAQYGGPYSSVANTIATSIVDTKTNVGGNNVYVIAVTDSKGNVSYSEQINLRISGQYQQNDLILFADKVHGGWASNWLPDNGGVELDPENGFYPVDNNMIYNNLPSLHIKTSVNEGQWMGGIAPKGWNAMNVEPFIENGTLEFNIKGAKGGEVFEFVLGGKKKDGSGDGDIVAFKTNSQFDITTEWQHISIPLSKIADLSGNVDLRSLRQVAIKEVGNGPDETPIEVWLNDMKIVTPDDEVAQNPIKVNQVGYHINADKYALVSGFAHKFETPVGTEFTIKNDKDEVVYTGKLTLERENDNVVSGDRILKADFTSIKTPGTYYLDVADVGKSQNFKIGDDIYTSLLLDATKYYYLQRGNAVIEGQYVGDEFARGEGLPQDKNVPLNSQRDGEKFDVSGGWYDAGDYGKYTNAAATAVSELLWSYEMFPKQFGDKVGFIPESGNDISDLLDEVKWELDFLLKMQDKKTGGFYAHVWAQNYDGTPDKALSMDRYIQDKNGVDIDVKPTTHTADTVAALAQAYTLFKNVDVKYADKLLAAAEYGYEYLEANPQIIISMPGEPYGDGDDTNNRLWAAAEMYRATGEAKYNKYFLNNYKNFEKTFDTKNNGHGWGNMEKVAYYAYASADNANSEAIGWFKEKFTAWSNAVIEKTINNPWGSVLGENDYSWGSNSTIADTLMDLYIGNTILGNNVDNTLAVMRSSMNYLLGVNPLAFSYVSGYGENCLENTYSNIYNYDKNISIPKGYFAGGPNQYEGAELSKFNARDYMDSGFEWTTNEHTIYWNSVLVFSIAALNDDVAVYATDIKLDKENVTIKAKDTLKLSAIFIPVNTTNKEVRWISSDETKVKVDNSGTITAISPGQVTITARTIDGGFEATCKIIVTNEAPEIIANDSVVNLGDKFDPMANVTAQDFEDGNITNNMEIVENTVDTTKVGEYKVIYKVSDNNGEECIKEIKITVVTVNVSGVVIDKTSVSIKVDETVQLNATVTPENASNKNVAWASSDDKIAIVDATGKVIAIAEGTATITITTVDGKYTATCEVTVSNGNKPPVIVNPSNGSVTISKIENLNGKTEVVIDSNKSLYVEITDIDAIKNGTGSVVIKHGDNTIEIPFKAVDSALLKYGSKVVFTMDVKNDNELTKGLKAVKKVFDFNLSVATGDETVGIHNFKNGFSTVTLSLSENELKGLDKDKLTVFYYNEETKKYEALETIVVGNKVTFKTNHFSKFIVAEKIIATDGSTLPETGSVVSSLYYVLLGTVLLVGGMFVLFKKREENQA